MTAFSVTEAMVSWISSLGHSASTRVPKGAPSEFVTVERVGGNVDSYVDHALVAIQAWAGTDARAEALANSLRLALLTAQPPGGIHSVRVNSGPYQFYDGSTRTPRYQLLLDVACQLEI